MSRTAWAVMLVFNAAMLAVTVSWAIKDCHSLMILSTIPWTAATTICLLGLTRSRL